MNFYKKIGSFLIACSFISAAIGAQEEEREQQDRSSHNQQLNERDLQALKQFVNSKRTMDLLEKVRNLTISGDVRTEWRHMNEFVNGINIRSGRFKDKNDLPISRNDIDIEANLRMEYVQENSWAVSHLRFDNSAGIDNNRCFCTKKEMKGICSKGKCKKRVKGKGCYQERFHGSGFGGNLYLRRAFMGYNVLCEKNNCGRLDVELGRRHLYDVFESEIQYLSRFDGVFVKYSKQCDLAKFYWNTAGFVVDERVDYYNWATETGLLDIWDTGFDFKYAYIDWKHESRDRCGVKHPRGFDFQNSQFTGCYHFSEEMCYNNQTEIYGAFLVNHAARKMKQNTAWYIGFYVGDVIREGDWSVDLQYQWVEPNSIAFDDQGGIGLGNTLDDQCGRGLTTGFQGYRIDALYALTDNITIEMIIESTNALHAKQVCQPRHKYNKLELEAVYAF